MAKKVTTIFIRDDSINLLVMQGNRVEKWAIMPLEPGLVSQGLIADEAQVAAKIKELLKLQELKSIKIIAGISGHESVYRIITLPELPEAVMPEAVKREAKRVIPMPLEEVYLSYQAVTIAKGETIVFLAAYPRKIADTLYKTLTQAGLQPYLMDLAPLALCRTVNQPRSIIVNQRADHLDIIVMSNQVPQLIRRLSIPRETESQAEMLATVTEEVDRTIIFYNSSHQEETLDEAVPMFVCGDLAREPENWQELESKSTHPVSILPSPVESPVGFDANEFMVNIGLGLKEVLPESGEGNYSLINMNTLPDVYLPKPARISNILAPIAITIGLGILVYLGILVINQSNHIDVLNSELVNLEDLVVAENQEVAALQGEIELITPQITELEVTTSIFDSTHNALEETRTKINENMGEIVSLLPGTLDLTVVDHTSELITVAGISPNESGIFSYARALRNSGRFSIVVLSSIEAREQAGKITGYNFELLLE